MSLVSRTVSMMSAEHHVQDMVHVTLRTPGTPCFYMQGSLHAVTDCACSVQLRSQRPSLSPSLQLLLSSPMPSFPHGCPIWHDSR